jgi:hypothetical protein
MVLAVERGNAPQADGEKEKGEERFRDTDGERCHGFLQGKREFKIESRAGISLLYTR